MKILETRSLALPEVKVLTYARFLDERGYFTETFRREQVGEALGVSGFEVAQANESHSEAKVVRGLHTQWNPWQGKLVRPIYGRLVDLALDIRKGSPTFGKMVAYDLPADPASETGEWIWIPPGFAHGAVFPEASGIEYFCTSAWSPGCETSLDPFADDLDRSLMNPDLKAELDALHEEGPLVNEKDREGASLSDWENDPRSDWFVYDENAPFGTVAEAE
jgi:dTDP-4-dehydrorhamnose 3,5-epimerase